jgi:hypothetical protein
MSTNRFLGLIGGVKTWFTALQTSAGATDANKIVMTASNGRLDSSLMPVGIGAATQSIVASEALVAGDFVNIFDNAGTPNCRKADSSNGRAAHGFVLIAVASAANATVYLGGSNTARTGLVSGSQYYLSTSGNIATTAPSAAGQIIQNMGAAASATVLQFDHDDPITIA